MDVTPLQQGDVTARDVTAMDVTAMDATAKTCHERVSQGSSVFAYSAFSFGRMAGMKASFLHFQL